MKMGTPGEDNEGWGGRQAKQTVAPAGRCVWQLGEGLERQSF